MGSETLVQGHAFDFETGICTRCGICEIEFERLGEPQCTGRETRGRWTVLAAHGAGRVRATRNESARPAYIPVVDVFAESRPTRDSRFAAERRPRLQRSVGSGHLVCFPERRQLRAGL